MVTILGPIGDDSIRMSQIPKLGDGINCVFLTDKRDKLAPIKYYVLVSGKVDKHIVEHEHFNQERAVQYCME